MYNFTNNWFEYSEIKREIEKYVDKDNINIFLEIGSYEGAFTCHISDNYLDSMGSKIICVDPFDISDNTSPVYNCVKKVFVKNITSSKNWQKIRLCELYSTNFFKNNKQLFTFIYIDGSHICEQIKEDFINSLKIIKQNGIIWLDDYASSEEVTNVIDEIYNNNLDSLEIIHKGYQIAFRKK